MATPSKGIRPTEDQWCKHCKLTLKMTPSGHVLHRNAHLKKLAKTIAKTTVKSTDPTPPADVPPPTPPPKELNPLACPECAASGIEKVFKSKIGRGHHRSQVHGYKGPNYQYYLNSRKKKKQESRAIIHAKEITDYASNGHSKNIIPGQEAKALFAAGYVKGRLDSFAESGNVPAAIFAQGVCQLVLDSAGGEGMGTEVHLPRMRRHSTT